VAEADLHELQLAAWRGLDGFGGRSSLRTWLYRIATNRCLNTLRDSSRRPQTEPIRTVEPTWLEPYPDVLLDDLPDVAPGPEGALRRSAAERELVGHYAEAFEQGDVDRLVALLSEDALMTMPPQPIEVHGPAAIADFFLAREWWGAGRAPRRHARERATGVRVVPARPARADRPRPLDRRPHAGRRPHRPHHALRRPEPARPLRAAADHELSEETEVWRAE
jgi:ketosteroid isomerase-like protein